MKPALALSLLLLGSAGQALAGEGVVSPFCDAACRAEPSPCVTARYGSDDRAPDYQAALLQCSAQAEAGDANAQVLLAELNFLGVGTPQDFRRAAYWYSRAAGAQHPHALAMLHEMERLHLIPANQALASLQ